MSIFFPLIPDSKIPAIRGWASPEFQGVEPTPGEWFGRRADGYVIVDCDTDAAAVHWQAIAPIDTFTVRTPRGRHYYYRWTPGSPEGPYVGVYPGIDIRAGRGSYVVWHKAPGYALELDSRPLDFDPSWLPEREQKEQGEGEAWEKIPDGRRNSTLTAFGGSLRKQGMAPKLIADALWAMNRTYCEPPLPDDEVKLIAQSIGRYKSDGDTGEGIEWEEGIEGTTLSIQWGKHMKLPPPPAWYWRPYFPEGKLVFMDGREGIGKGMFCTWLAHSVASGRAPDGSEVEPANVLWLPTEDDPEEDILRRLFAAGYERGKSGADIGFINARLKVPEHEDILIDAIRESEAKLVILDPGRSYLGLEAGQQAREFSYNNEAHIRPGMESLIRVAKVTGATILFVHHWNKDSKSDIFYRQSGSGGFNQVIRHRVTVARVEHEGLIDGAFGVTKSNISDPGHVHGYTLEPVEKYETAKFVLTQPMPEWTSLDEWYKAAQEKRQDELQFIPVDTLFNELGFTLTKGSELPPRRELMAATGLSQKALGEACKVLAEEGILAGGGDGKAYVWMGE